MGISRSNRGDLVAVIFSAEFVFNGGKALPKEISDQIVERTDGVPLFIEELTKTVVESGIVSEAGEHYALAC